MRYEADMYNKLFTKILDSSIWLEDDSTRLIWLTFLAVMDQDGFAQFASVANLAYRARVPLVAAQQAVAKLEGPDPDSSDPDHEGRRVERIAGGWMVLNAGKYRDLVTREIARERTRERVRKHRAGNAAVTVANDSVTQSETETDSDPKTKTEQQKSAAAARQPVQGAGAFAPGSLPRHHLKHVVCGPHWRICLIDWQVADLAAKYGGDRDTALAAIRAFVVATEQVVGDGPTGDFRWLQEHFAAWMGQQGRTAASAPKAPKSAPYRGVAAILADEAAAKAARKVSA